MSRKRAKPGRRAKAREVSVLARESPLGRRVRRLEALLQSEPERSETIAMAFTSRWSETTGLWQRHGEGPHFYPNGHVTGTYRLGQYREVLFWGPEGLSPEETQAIHRAEVARMLTDPEYAQPYPEPLSPTGERSIHLHLDSGAIEIRSGEPEPMTAAERLRTLYPNGRLRNGGPVLRTANN